MKSRMSIAIVRATQHFASEDNTRIHTSRMSQHPQWEDGLSLFSKLKLKVHAENSKLNHCKKNDWALHLQKYCTLECQFKRCARVPRRPPNFAPDVNLIPEKRLFTRGVAKHHFAIQKFTTAAGLIAQNPPLKPQPQPHSHHCDTALSIVSHDRASSHNGFTDESRRRREVSSCEFDSQRDSGRCWWRWRVRLHVLTAKRECDDTPNCNDDRFGALSFDVYQECFILQRNTHIDNGTSVHFHVVQNQRRGTNHQFQSIWLLSGDHSDQFKGS